MHACSPKVLTPCYVPAILFYPECSSWPVVFKLSSVYMVFTHPVDVVLEPAAITGVYVSHGHFLPQEPGLRFHTAWQEQIGSQRVGKDGHVPSICLPTILLVCVLGTLHPSAFCMPTFTDCDVSLLCKPFCVMATHFEVKSTSWNVTLSLTSEEVNLE